MSRVEPTLDLEVLRQWIGRRETLDDNLDPRQARLLQATLERNASLAAADSLPPLWHWIYFLSGAPTSQLGPDGHAARGGLLPPVDLPRRMWAGGRIRWLDPLLLGRPATRTSTVTAIEMKTGRSGQLCFVTVTHEISSEGQPVLEEEQDLVFREAPGPADTARPAKDPPESSDWVQEVTLTPVELFRYSALTFNGHRIHYDRKYVTEAEGYPGLIVHGPLIATLLADLATDRIASPMRSFDFVAVAPLFDSAPFTIHGRRDDHGVELWAQTPAGGLAMTARATF